jgi:hypothetical protein
VEVVGQFEDDPCRELVGLELCTVALYAPFQQQSELVAVPQECFFEDRIVEEEMVEIHCEMRLPLTVEFDSV